MSWALSPSNGQPYGLAGVCRIWRVARASVYRHRNPQPDRQRRGPAGPLPDPALDGIHLVVEPSGSVRSDRWV